MSELIKTNRKLKHAEGLKLQYDFDSMKDVLYITTDSNEIIFNNRILGLCDLNNINSKIEKLELKINEIESKLT